MRIPLVLHAHPRKRTVAATDVEGALCALLVPAAAAEPGARAAATSAVNELCAARRRWLTLFHAGDESDDENDDDGGDDAALEDHAAAQIIATQMYVAHLRALTAAPALRAATTFAWTAAYGAHTDPVAANDTAFEAGEVLVAAALWLLRLAAHAAARWVAPTRVLDDAPFLAPSPEQEQEHQEQGRQLKVDATVVVEEVLQCALSLLNAYTVCVRRLLCDRAHAAALPADLGVLVPVLRAQTAAQLREVAVLRACAAAASPRTLAARCARLAARYDTGVAQALADVDVDVGEEVRADLAPFAAYARTKTLVYRALAAHFRALAALEAFRPHEAARRAAAAAALLRDAVAAAIPAGPAAQHLAHTVHDAVEQFRDALLAAFSEGSDEDNAEEDEQDEAEEEQEEEQEEQEGGGGEEDDDDDEELVGAVGMPEAMSSVWTPEVVHAFRAEPVPPLLAPWRDAQAPEAPAEAVPEQDDTQTPSGTCTIC